MTDKMMTIGHQLTSQHFPCRLKFAKQKRNRWPISDWYEFRFRSIWKRSKRTHVHRQIVHNESCPSKATHAAKIRLSNVNRSDRIPLKSTNNLTNNEKRKKLQRKKRKKNVKKTTHENNQRAVASEWGALAERTTTLEWQDERPPSPFSDWLSWLHAAAAAAARARAWITD